MAGLALHLLEGRVEQGCAELIPCNVRDMSRSKFGCRLFDTVIVAAENNLAVRMEPGPALDGVALDNPDMSLKRLGNREYGQHRAMSKRIPNNWC